MPDQPQGSRSLRPRPRLSLKAQELSQLSSSSPFSEHKAILRIVPTRRSHSKSRLMRESPARGGPGPVLGGSLGGVPRGRGSATSSHHAFSPLPSPTTTDDMTGFATPPSSQPTPKQQQSGGSNKRARSRPSAAPSSHPNISSSFESTKSATPEEDLDNDIQASLKTSKLIVLPTRASKKPSTNPVAPVLTAPEIPTFDYYQTILPTQEDSIEEEEDDIDDATDAIQPYPPSSEHGPDSMETRRQAKAFLDKEGFYNWSVKKAIHAHDQHQRQQQEHHQTSYSNSNTPSPLLSARSHPTSSTPGTIVSITKPSGGGVKHLPHPKDPLRLTTSGRITRSMSGPSRPKSPRRRLIDSRTIAHDLKMDRQTSIERHHWALRDLNSAASMLEMNSRNMAEQLGLGGNGGGSGTVITTAAERRRKAAYAAMAEKHVAMLKEMENDWENWVLDNPKELGEYSMKRRQR